MSSGTEGGERNASGGAGGGAASGGGSALNVPFFDESPENRIAKNLLMINLAKVFSEIIIMGIIKEGDQTLYIHRNWNWFISNHLA